MENKDTNRLGIFTAGFRWSGSSAVSDWLESFSAVKKPEGCEAAYDEIRALNYGLTIFLKLILKKIYVGEKLARYSFCPEKKEWNLFFKHPFYLDKGIIAPFLAAADTFFMFAAKERLNPGLDMYGPMLNSQLGRDYLNDDEYLKVVNRFTESVRDAVRKKPRFWKDVASDKNLSDSVSALFALFYDRYKLKGYVPVLDNAISGLNPHFYDLLNKEYFQKKVIIFVVRDPRDQFAEQVKFSAKTYSFMSGKFVSDYQKKYEKTAEFVSSMKNDPDSDVYLLSFEDFVCNTKNLRSNLEKTISEYLDISDIKSEFNSSSYIAENSLKNIGIWKKSGMKKEMDFISRKLRPFLKEQAD